MFDVNKPKQLLETCPVYHETPIKEILLNHQKVIIKDESHRMGLGSFKALGGFYAVTQLIANKVNKEVSSEDYFSPLFKETAKSITFVCASAGNHGIAVAAGAKIFGARCRIHLASTVPEYFAERLENKGAQVVRSGNTYEESVAAAIADAEKSSAIHLADGSWPGYTEIPRLVMEGYTIIAEEMRQTFEQTNNWPSHVFLQAGVGGLAAAITFMIRDNWPVQPKIIVVEPELAPCLRASVNEGLVCTVEGSSSNMGRLDCKTASLLAFNILKEMADSFITVSDDEASKAVTIAQEIGIDTTPSGAAGLAAVLNHNPNMTSALIIITEGNTNNS